MENSIEFLKNLKIELPYNPAILLLSIYPKGLKIRHILSALGWNKGKNPPEGSAPTSGHENILQ